jgi:2-iminobutanoate/2-iminopropanoate deaminase
MRNIIKTDHAPKAIGPYNQAIEVNGFLFISGQVPIVPSTGKFIAGGIKEQTEQVLKNIEGILSAAGYTVKDVVKTTCLLTDMANYSDMNAVYGTVFNEDPPARAAFATNGLPLGALIEIEAIASK